MSKEEKKAETRSAETIIFSYEYDPFVSVYINKDLVNDFNHLVYSFNINKKISEVNIVLNECKVVYRRTTIEYLIYLLKSQVKDLISEAKKRELLNLLESSLVGVPESGVRDIRMVPYKL